MSIYIILERPDLINFTAASFAAGYLSGSVPYGLLLGKAMGYGDIRKSGSGNIGATNALRVGGKKLAIATLICDLLKAFLPVLIAKYFRLDYAIAAGFGAYLGHLFPIWLKFKGGKGIASGAGVALAFNPILGASLISIWLAVAYFTRYSSLAALTASAAAPLISMYITESPQVTIVIIFIAFLSFIKHRDNIVRIIKDEETRIEFKK